MAVYSYLPVTQTVTVPVCFYPSNKGISQAPEQVTIRLEAPRAVLATIEPQSLAVYVNTENMKAGVQPLSITHNMLLLPSTIKLIDYTPVNNFILIG